MGHSTDRKNLLWFFHEVTTTTKFLDAGKHEHHPKGYGYLCVPAGNDEGRIFVRCWYTPSLPATIISPSRLAKELKADGFASVGWFLPERAWVHFFHQHRRSQDAVVPCILRDGLLFTESLIKPTPSQRSSPLPEASLCVHRVKSLADLDTQAPPAASCSCACQARSDVSSRACPGSCESESVDSSPPCPLPACSRCSGRCDLCEPADSAPSCSFLETPLTGPDPEPPPISIASDTPSSMPDPEPPPDPASFDTPSSKPDPEPPNLLADPDAGVLYQIRALTRKGLERLWHTRLGHIHHRRVSDAYKYADGIPKLLKPTDIDACPICQKAKLRHASAGTDSLNKATICGQGISLDFGFVVQNSSNTARARYLQGLHGETCYVLLTDHHSGTLYGQCFASKAPPIEWLNKWLAAKDPGQIAGKKYARMDLGGELGRCTELVDLLQRAGYEVECTAPGSSSQNGLGERPHQTIGNAMRAMLSGAGLEPKFWPYAFHHTLRLHNLMPHAGSTKSPYEICSGRRPNLALLRTFGCHVTAEPSTRPGGRRPEKPVSDARTGTFLGYAQTLRNILYYDHVTGKVKPAQHCTFNESMDGVGQPSPNSEYVRVTLKDELPADPTPIGTIDLDVSENPFRNIVTETVRILDDESDPSLGFDINHCTHRLRAYVAGFRRNSSASRIHRRKRLVGAYLVSIGGVSVFSSTDALKELHKAFDNRHDDDELRIEFALEPLTEAVSHRRPPLHLQLSQLQRIHAVRVASGEDVTSAIDNALSDLKATVTDDELGLVMRSLRGDNVTDAERALGHITR